MKLKPDETQRHSSGNVSWHLNGPNTVYSMDWWDLLGYSYELFNLNNDSPLTFFNRLVTASKI